jgi:7-keto-8-aminopelargonate synthetase-like enzyme
MKIDVPPSAIVPVILGSEERVLHEAARLQNEGFFITPIRYPTVPRNTARLRITLSSAHSPEEILSLAAALKESGLRV